MSLHILHISNDFPNTPLYKQLVLHLTKLDIKQSVYSAVRTSQEASYSPPELQHYETSFRNILQPYDRILYRNKINKIAKDVIQQIDIDQIDLIHSHTLYSDGGVALKLKEQLNIPFVVAVRNTDLNAFQRFRPDLRFRRNKILSEAEKIILISPAYKNKLLKLLNNLLKRSVKSKSVIVPNGLDPLFLQCSHSLPVVDKSNVRLLYVGNFRKLKNVPVLIEAVDILNSQEDMKFILTIVGDGGEQAEKVKKIISSNKISTINYYGKVTDREELRNIYMEHDMFVMTSKPETFGLVYIEALSQGLPIVYTKGEGIDGYFKNEGVGEVVIDTRNPNEIASKIKELSARLNLKLKERCVAEAQRFDWNKISETYHNIYTKVLDKGNIT